MAGHSHGASRRSRLLRWSAVVLAGLAAVLAATVGVDRLFSEQDAVRWPWPPEPCVVEGIDARCGTFDVPENRAEPGGRTIGLKVVVLPAFSKSPRAEAVAFLAGGPGNAATDEAASLHRQLGIVNLDRDILLVDQRGTGGSSPGGGDATQYGTRMAMDDLDAVRAALGYPQLDVIGSSYGATAAQVYLTLHPDSVRTLVLTGATAVDIPIFDRWAVNSQRALDQLARLCADDDDCSSAYPGWQRQFGTLVRTWNAEPVNGITGDELAAVVHEMLLDVSRAVSIPFVVSRAAAGDPSPLEREDSGTLDVELDLMGASIYCNEPWAGLGASGPWGTRFDSYTTALLAAFRKECSSVPRRVEPASLWTLPVASRVPVLAFAGGADPQDPPANLGDLERHFPDSRTVVFPHLGHQFRVGGCAEQIIADFLDRGTTEGVDTTRCDGAVIVPSFVLPD